MPTLCSTYANHPNRRLAALSDALTRCPPALLHQPPLQFGFIKAASAEARYFFHVRDSDGRTSLGATVTFVIAQDLTTGKHVAYHVQTLAQRAQQARVQEERLPGSFLGTLIALPRGPAGVCVDDGVVAFTNSAGLEQQALFGAGRVAPGALLQLGADVQFGLVRNLATRVFKAVDVRPADPLAVASQHLPLSGLGGSGDVLDSLPSGRQLGRVALLKKEFGFLRQLARPGDMFFHFSQLEGVPPEEIHVGDDVEFAVRRDRDGKQSAVAVRRAAPGLVVFDVVSEKELRGVVVERPAAGKPHMATSGVIGYEVPSSVVGAAAGAEGAPLPPPPPAHAKLTFAAADAQGAASLRVGDHVTFRVATNLAAARAAASASTPGAAQHAGRRAVQVAAVRCCGIVALVNADRKFGFITYEEGAAPAAEAELQPPEAEADTETEAEQENGGTNAGLTAQDRAPAPPPAASSAIATAAIEETPAVAAAVAPAAVAAAAPAVQRRIFFHFSEVAGGVTLRVGDEVAFVLSSHQKRDPATGVKERGEVHASRVKRTKEAPAVTHPEARSPGVKPDLAALLRNPNKPKLTGNLQSGEHKTQRMPKVR